MFQRYIFVVALAFTAHSLASCYWPNGTVANVGSGNRVQKPCNKTPGVHSMCCFLEGPSNPPTLDTCTPDGLCKPQDNYHIWRGTCTDSTWQDPACLNLCTVGKNLQGFDFADKVVALSGCADGSYCCDADDRQTAACCGAHNGFFVQNGRVTSSPALNSSNPATSISTVPGTPTPNQPSSNTGAIVGGVVGGIAVITVLALAFWYFVLRRKATRSQDQPPRQHYETQNAVQDIPSAAGVPNPGAFQAGFVPAEFNSAAKGIRQEPKEVAANDSRRELDSIPRQELEGHRVDYGYS